MKLKDIETRPIIIKIIRIKEHYREKNVHRHKDKLISIEINHPSYNAYTCFDDNKQGNKKLLEFIKKELFLK